MKFTEATARAFDFLRHRKQYYQLTFDLKNPADEEVLKDLAKFCRANETGFDPDQRVQDVLIGRREVWLRITQHLNLTPHQLYLLYSGVPQTED